MDLIIAAVKVDLNDALNTGRYMLVSLFGVAVFVRYTGLLSHHVNWADIVLRVVVGFILLQNYTWVMDTTRNIVVGVDETINPNQDFVSQYAIMGQNIQKRNQDMTRQSVLTQIKNGLFGPLSLHNFVINLSFIAYAVLSKVMESVRYSMTAILYKLGPVLIPLVLFQSTGAVVRGWMTSYVSVLCWPILWHIVLGIAVNLSNQQIASGSIVEQFVSINFAVCFVLVFSPLIVNHLVSGVGAGAASALAGIASSKAVINMMTGMGQAGVALAAAKVAQPLMQRFSKLDKTPTTADGKFKSVMLGDQNKGEKP